MASLTKSARQERARILRELLLRTGLKRRAHPTTDYTDALADLTSEMVVTDTNNILSVSVTDMMGNATDARHTLIAACRLIMGTLETAPGRSAKKVTLTAHLTARGFTANSIAAALGWMTEQHLVTVTNGTVTDVTGDRRPSNPRPQLPAELVAPRTTAPSTTSTGTTANRPNMPVDERMIQPPERVDMGERMRAQSQAMPNPSFEVGDIPAAPKKDEKPAKSATATVAIPDSVLVSYIDAITSAFARYGKPSATWRELGVRLPSTELPEGSTKQTTAAAALDKLAEGGTIRHESGVYTYVPAESAVAGLTEWIGESAKAGVLITPAAARALAQREDVQRITPNGWNAETLVALALDAVVISGAIERVDGGWMKPAPKTEQKPVAPAPAPKPAGDTTSDAPDPKPEGTATVAPASGQTPESNKSETPEKSETPPAAKPVSNTALEKKVDVLTGEVRAIGARLHTLPAPPSKEQVMLTDASPEARHLLEKILVQLKVKQLVVEEENEKKGKKDKGEQHFAMTRDDLKSRMPGRARVTATNPNPPDYRKHVNAALELGRAMGVIEYTEKWLGGSYVFITHVNVMSRAELDRRVQRVLDIRKARAEKQDAA